MLAVIQRKIFLSSILLSKNVKINIYRTIILPVFCMGVKLGAHIEGEM